MSCPISPPCRPCPDPRVLADSVLLLSSPCRAGGDSYATMNLVGLLQACGSNQRGAAESRLQALEATDGASFMLACAGVLADSSIGAPIRGLAAILLKNAIGTREVVRGKELGLRWQAVDDTSKAHIRLAILGALSDPMQKDVRRAAALCVARAGMVDIPAGRWPQAVPALTGLIADAGVPGEVRSTALWTVGLLADEWTFTRPKEAEYREVADQLFVTSARVLQEACPVVRLSASTTLSQIMQWTVSRQQRNSPKESVELLHVVLRSCAVSEPEDLRIEALKCLAECAKACYSHITPVLEELASCTLAAMGSSCEMLVLAALDVWSAIAEKEDNLSFVMKNPRRASEVVHHHIVRRAQPVLVPALLEVLVRGAQAPADNVDSEDCSNLLHVAAECLDQVTRVVNDECIAFVKAFFERHAQQSMAHCRAALVALGATQAKTSNEAMAKLVECAVPCLIDAFKSGSSSLATSAAWVAGAIAEHHLPILSLSTQEVVYVLCVERLSVDQNLTVQVCYCLDMLLVKQTTKMPASLFEDITGKLLSSAVAATTDRARSALLSTLGEMVKLATDDCIVHLVPLLSKLLAWAENAGGRPVEGVAPCLRSLTLRLGAQHMASGAEKMLKVYLNALSVHSMESGCLDPETLRAAGALAVALGPQFLDAMPRFWPVLQKAMTDIDEPDVCLAGLAAFQDVIRALGRALQPYVPVALDIAIRGLTHRESLDMRIRIDFIGCIAEITLAVGMALPELHKVLHILSEEVACIHERQSEKAAEVCSSAGKDQNQVINIILMAYEAVMSSLHGSEGNQAALQQFVVGMLDFVCCFARSMQTHATNHSWNLGIMLVGRMASIFPKDLAALASRSREVRDLIQELHRVSVETSEDWGGALLRPFSAPLANVLQASLSI